MGKILALEASTNECSVALFNDGDIHQSRAVGPRDHTRKLLPMVEQLLAQQQLSLNQLDAVAVGRGPGAFTGLRVAVSIAQGLAFGADLPIVPISTLAALARAGWRRARSHKIGVDCLIIPALDARKEELYWGIYRVDETTSEAGAAESVAPPAALRIPAALKQGHGFIGVGNGWCFREQCEGIAADDLIEVWQDESPQASDIAVLAHHQWLGGEGIAAQAAVPTYIRDQVTG